MRDNVENWFSLVKDEPGLAFMFGLLIGIAIREIIHTLDSITIWIRLKLLGDKRKGGNGNEYKGNKQSNSSDKN